MFALNVLATISGGYYSRNDKIKTYLDDFNAEYPVADEVIDNLNLVAQIIDDFKLNEKSIWFNKANFFTMVCEIATDQNLSNIDKGETSKNLELFAVNPPREFQVAAREAVNNRPERILRADMFRGLVAYNQ